MRVERFSLFFPPTLFKFSTGETEYAVGADPGGRLREDHRHEPGRAQPSSILRVADAPITCSRPGSASSVILAGPGMNMLIAFVLFAACCIAGNLGGANTLAQPRIASDHHDRSTGPPSTRSCTATRPTGCCCRATGSCGRRASGATVASTVAATSSRPCPGTLKDGCRGADAAFTRRAAPRTATARIAIYPRYATADRRRCCSDLLRHRRRRIRAARRRLDLRTGRSWGTTASTVSGTSARPSRAPRPAGISPASSASREVTEQAVALGTGIRPGDPGLRLAGPGGHQPLPVPAAGRRPRALVRGREGPRRGASRCRDVAVQLGRHHAASASSS